MRYARYFIHFDRGGDVDIDLVGVFAPFCCYDDHPVGTEASVKRRCGSSFQEVDTFDVVRIDVGESGTRIIRPGRADRTGLSRVYRCSVDDDQRRVVAGNGVESADDDFTRRSGLHRGADINPCHLTRKRFERVGVHHIGNLFVFDEGGRVTERFLFALDPEGCDYDAFELHRIVGKNHRHIRCCDDLFGVHPDKSEHQGLPGIGSDGEFSVKVGLSSSLGAFDEDVYTRKRQTALVCHHTAYVAALRIYQLHGKEQKQCNDSITLCFHYDKVRN